MLCYIVLYKLYYITCYYIILLILYYITLYNIILYICFAGRREIYQSSSVNGRCSCQRSPYHLQPAQHPAAARRRRSQAVAKLLLHAHSPVRVLMFASQVGGIIERKISLPSLL